MLRQLFFCEIKEGGFIDNTELLKYAIENGIIDLEHVQEEIEMKEREELLKKHPYSIWKGKDGRWYTYLPDEEKKRGKALKKRNSQREIENVVIEFWKERKKKERIYSFDDVYYMWRKIQDQLVSGNSVVKYNTDYNRFFKETEFTKRNIEEIDEDCIKIFMCQTIKKCELGKESARKLYGYISNTIRCARKKKIIENNPLEFLQSKDFYKYCTEVYKPDNKKIISREDMKLLQVQFKKDHLEKPNYIPTYAVELASLTGMRVGEIAALTWESITDEYIIIDKSEKVDRSQNRVEFYIDKTKNGKIRFFPITDEIKELLEKLKSVEQEYGYLCEWVFANENGRIHAPMISACSKAKCRQLGIDSKGIHAYRKTLNSNLRCRGVSATVAASMLGHTKEVNEQYYTFDVTDISERAKIISEINADMYKI